MEKIIIQQNETKTIDLMSFSDLEIVVLDDAKLTLKILSISNEDNKKIHIELNQNSSLEVIYADFGNGNYNINSVVDLNKIGASCIWKLASLSNNKDIKQFDISFNHFAPQTKAIMDNYGVARDESTLIFKGINHIHEHCPLSETRQNAKIIVFDQFAKGKASPALKIDENDVVASHGATVGQLSTDHMFYLMSRGLSKKEARQLITLGYLKPISNYFDEDKKQMIHQAITEVL